MVWWAWPNDPGLPQLPALMDPLLLAPRLPAGLLRPGETLTEVQALRYEPEVRATLQATLQAPQGARTIYGKTFDDGRGQVVHQRFVAAWRQAAADPLAAAGTRAAGLRRRHAHLVAGRCARRAAG
jgi:hypothetical protein